MQTSVSVGRDEHKIVRTIPNVNAILSQHFSGRSRSPIGFCNDMM